MNDTNYYNSKINEFKQKSKKPLITRVNTLILAQAIGMDIDYFTSIRYESPKAILLHLAEDYHKPKFHIPYSRERQAEIVLFVLYRIMEKYYPWKCVESNEVKSIDDGKIQFNKSYDRINSQLLLEVGYRKTLGDTGKYLPGSWCMLDSDTFLNGALRHILKHDKGIIDDEEGGTHLSAAVWGLTCLYWTLSESVDNIKLAHDNFKKFKLANETAADHPKNENTKKPIDVSKISNTVISDMLNKKSNKETIQEPKDFTAKKSNEEMYILDEPGGKETTIVKDINGDYVKICNGITESIGDASIVKDIK